MNLRQVARLLAGFAGVFTLAELPPLLLALIEAPNAHRPITGFATAIAVSAAVAAALWWLGRRDKEQVFRRETIAVAALSWFLAGALGAIPFWLSGVLTPVDAMFEAISGLTTCGATVLGSGGNLAIEAVPASLLLWRALLQWIGGIGIMLVFVALLPAVGAAAKALLSSESVGISSESYQPRAVEKARQIAVLYVAMTIACTLLLVWTGGFGWFDAICHAFTTMATGGYSTRSSLAAFDTLAGEIVLIVFMFLAGASLALIAANLRTGVRCLVTLVKSAEFRIYSIAATLLVGACTLVLIRAGLPLGTALRQAAFNGISVLTSTGYATVDFQAWPTPAIILLFSAMCVGGCSGSTTGGFKQVRLLVVLRLLGYTLRQFVRPKSVERIRLDNEVLPAAVISSILAVALLWMVTIVVFATVVSLDERMNFLSALATCASVQGTCGPGLTLVEPTSAQQVILEGGVAEVLAGTPNVGPFGGYAELRTWTKVVLAVEMVLGRLELLTVLALFSPRFWRR